MDASHDRAAYFNTEPRALWLGQVSEAATALAGTRVPKQLIESVGVSKILTEPSAANAGYFQMQMASQTPT